MSFSGEHARITRLAEIYAGAARDAVADGVDVGIGDDAAVLAPPPGEKLVWTVDEQVEGTHFRRDLASFRDIGYRAFMAAASDVAAMGARPWCAVSSLVLPADLDDDDLDALAAGTREAAGEIGVRVVGGNLARGSSIAIGTSVLGVAVTPLTRSGARAGDGLFVAGALGLAAAGFRALDTKVQDARIDAAVAAWRRPRALREAGVTAGASPHAHAAIDVSDGLAQDAGHVARASGVALVLDADALLAHGGSALADASDALGASALDLCLRGGEDYALLVAASAPIAGFTRIGDVRDAREMASGARVYLRDAHGERALDEAGFDHFVVR